MMREPVEGWRVSHRACCALCIAVPILALILHGASDDQAIAVAVKLLLGSVTATLVPGALVILAMAPRRLPLTVLEFTGIAIALSFAAIQVLTMTSLLLHVSTWTIAIGLVLVSAGAAGLMLWWRGPDKPEGLPLTAEDLALGLAILLVATVLYVKGSPVFSDEDQMYAAMVRRFAVMDRPSIGGFYHAAGAVFPHPFPGVQFLMGLVSRLSGVDGLFVYHKLRFFWAFAAMTFVVLAARQVFATRRIAVVTAVAAIVFTMNGGFAAYPHVFWAQLAPFSHPADVAMNVYLPALLVLTFYYLRAAEARHSQFFLGGALALACSLAIVHIRELVQFWVYLVGFMLACVVVRGAERPFKKLALLLAPTIAVALVYVAFHRALVLDVASQDALAKEQMLHVIKTASLRRLFKAPLGQFTEGVQSMVYRWNGIVLALSPLVVVAFHRWGLVLLMGASILIYLLLVRLPLLTVPYVYLTYYEILLTPARNVSFFVYLLTGPLLYLVAVNLSRITQMIPRLAATLATATVLGLIVRDGSRFLARHLDAFFLPAFLLYGGALWLLRRDARPEWIERLLPDPPRPL